MYDFEIELPPADVVPRTEVTPVVADLLKTHIGTQVMVHFPGEPIETMDGELLGMDEPRSVTATLARLHISNSSNAAFSS